MSYVIFPLQLFTETLEIAEHVNLDFATLDEWIKATNLELRKDSAELPENPEPVIERIKVGTLIFFKCLFILLYICYF